ncbi:3-oxoacyl-ACP synthase III family protein [Burkholderia sp. D-99]|uniref:3-oxoacyl-ACP synthase III family protein n=1 Tax=unclassified Burkholderia TaxID=2613784 RepID=UPI0014236E07|nr:3-oxoacyl-[acyl-carrier-protein] synthase III C-terminal domain-containing protein [Burkholderia sp. D-99]NHV28550.1 3-oxoacyl-ACP synthase [Burkholderia sp. D-99]
MSAAGAGFGIRAFGYAFGEETSVAETAADYVTDPERVLQWGCTTYRRARHDEFALDFAARAARQALERASLRASDLDLVVLGSAEMPEYMYWDSAAALARMLDLERTQTLVFNNEGCSAGLRPFGMIAGAFALQPEVDRALFVVVNRVGEHHRNRMNINNCVHSDGAVAAVLQRGHARCQWLATEHFTLPEYCDLFRGEYGGTKTPVPPAGWSSRNESGYESVHRHFKNDASRLKVFLDHRNDWLTETVDAACARSGLTRRDVDHLIYINDARPGAIEALGKQIGVPVERTNFAFAGVLGHMGAADHLVSLGQHVERGEIRDGDIVAMCGMSTGMHWCCTLLRA